MSDDTSPIPEQPVEVSAHPRIRVRWQIAVLIGGLAMIMIALIFMLRGVGPTTVIFPETQTYTEAIYGQPRWVNPLLATSQADRDLVSLVYSGLTRIDEYGQPVPDLAQNWEVSPDGLTYTFHLRPGVTWHDGVPFTAEDVAFTMSLLRDSDYPGPADLGAFWRTVETYADDSATVRFVLTQPLAAFPEYAGIGILPLHKWGGIDPAALPDDPLNLSPVGTGRLQWVEIRDHSGSPLVRLRPYPGYYDQSRRVVRLAEVDLHFFRDSNQAFRTLGGDTQGLGGLSAAQLEAALASPGLSLYSARLPIYAAVIFNQQSPARLPFLQDENVRRALAMALDRNALLDGSLARQAMLAESAILPGTWAYNPALTPTVYDPTGAATLLDQAGWALTGGVRSREGVNLAFNLLVSNQPADRALGQAIVDQWRALGVNVTLQAVDAETLQERVTSPPTGDQGRDFDAALVEIGQGGLADPDPYPFWAEAQSTSGQNYSGFADQDISEALEIARRESNGVRRAELYRAFQQWFLDRGAAILLYNPLYHYAVSCQVQGVQLFITADPSERFRNLHEWQILTPAEAAQVCPR